MEVVALLLICAMGQQLCPATSSAIGYHNNLNANLQDIIINIGLYNKTISREFFVDDLQYLHDAGCNNVFFCKALHILKNHALFSTSGDHEHHIVNNLKTFTENQNMECNKTPGTNGHSVKKPITELLRFLESCSQKRNTHGRGKRS